MHLHKGLIDELGAHLLAYSGLMVVSVSDVIGLRGTPSCDNFYSAYGTRNLVPISGNRFDNQMVPIREGALLCTVTSYLNVTIIPVLVLAGFGELK